MSEIHVSITPVTPASIQQALQSLDHLLAVAQSIATITHNQALITMVTTATAIVKSVEPYLSEPWVPEVLNFVIGLFQQNPQVALQTLEATARSLMAGQ